jgi:hypothetical protein
MPEHDPRLFFQVAAGLIPALIFGGLISEKLKPPPATRHWSWLGAFAVPPLALAVLLAEVLAINAALSGKPDAFATWLVALVVVGLTAGALGVLAAPWYSRVADTASRRVRRLTTGLTAVLSILLVVEAADLLASAVQAEQSSQQLAMALAKADQRDTASQLLSAYDRMYQARAEAGLVTKAQARNVHVCLTDRAFLEAFQGAAESVAPDFKPLPADLARNLLPGKPIQCRGMVALPDPLPGLKQP